MVADSEQETPGSCTQDNIAPGKSILYFGERVGQMEQEEGAQGPNFQSSNEYQRNSHGVNLLTSPNIPRDFSLSRAARSNGIDLSTERTLRESSNPPNLGSRHRGESIGVHNNDVGHKEVIKSSIGSPLRYGNIDNDIALFFFKRFIKVPFAVNRYILLTKWIPGSKTLIAKATDITYNKEATGEYCAGTEILYDKK